MNKSFNFNNSVDYEINNLMDTSDNYSENTKWCLVVYNENLSKELNDILDKQFGQTKWGIRTTNIGTSWKIIIYKDQYDIIKPILTKYIGLIGSINYDDPYKNVIKPGLNNVAKFLSKRDNEDYTIIFNRCKDTLNEISENPNEIIEILEENLKVGFWIYKYMIE